MSDKSNGYPCLPEFELEQRTDGYWQLSMTYGDGQMRVVFAADRGYEMGPQTLMNLMKTAWGEGREAARLQKAMGK